MRGWIAGGPAWRKRPDYERAPASLTATARSAAWAGRGGVTARANHVQLLVSGDDLALVRVCGLFDSRECGWLFLDETKSHTRRWCSIKDCGNKARARRHYERAKRAPP